MKGDFTRGHQPDQKRGKRYRRVLLQQGRVLLDSDVAALVDANDRSLRELGEDLGCRMGSPDYGFLITTGKLYSLFDRIDHVTPGAAVVVHRDYEHKLHDRFPSLYVEGTAGGPGDVLVDLLTPHPGDRLVVWARAESSTTITIQDEDDVVFSLPLIVPAGSFAPIVVTLPVATTAKVRFLVDPGERVWIGMIESYEEKPEPSFWVAPGRFYLDGLVLENSAHASWPDQAFPSSAGFALTPVTAKTGLGGHLLVYLEAWERLHTHRHDRGIREEALGGRLDTTVRTEALGQVKLFHVASAPEAEALIAAMAEPAHGNGTLDIAIAPAIDDPDPCALPIEGGYTGTDNRLYHFEVHVGGSLGTAEIKWSRDNGSELFTVEVVDGNEFTVAAGSGLQDGDLIEILSEVVELGDAAEAVLSGGQFTPPVRLVGQLALLVAQGADSLGREVYALVTVDDPAIALVLDTTRYPQLDELRLRRWHGLIDTEIGEPSYAIENGISVELAGTQFDVGDWWEWEARVLQANDNGVFQTSPHGPERRFCPLAQFENINSTAPLPLVRWFDHRFTSLCELDADHVAFDGASVCSDADTVQEALLELYERTGCCEVKFSPCHPSAIPDQQLIAALILTELPNGGVLCLNEGHYVFTATLDLANLDGLGSGITGTLVIEACGNVVIEQTNASPLFSVGASQRLRLEDLAIYTGSGVAPAANTSHVRLAGHRAVIEAERCVFVMANGVGGAVIRDGASLIQPVLGQIIEPVVAPTPPPFPTPNADVLLRDCTMLATTGVQCGSLMRLQLDGCLLRCQSHAVSVGRVLELDLQQSTLTDSLTPAALVGITASSLQINRNRAREIANDFAISPPGSGFGFASVFVAGGTIANCRIAARVAIFVDVLWTTRVSDSQVRSTNHGIWINQALGSSLVDLQVDAMISGIGIAIYFVARVTAIENCRVMSLTRAIEVATLAPPVGNTIAIESVRIVDNEARAGSSGIRVGRPAAPGFIAGVVISGNQVDQMDSSGGVAIDVGRFSDGDREGVLIEGNTTRWTGSGLQVFGRGLAMVANRITVDSDGTGIAIDNANDAVVANNMIEVLSPHDGIVGIHMKDSERVNIHDNHMTALPSEIEIIPLRIENFGIGTTVAGNRLCLGLSLIMHGQNMTLRGNHLLGGMLIIDVENGDITGNQADGEFKYEGGPSTESIIAEKIFGRWKLSDNVARCSLRLIPMLIDQQTEHEIRAIVTDNQCERLQVGWMPDGVAPDDLPWWDDGLTEPFESTEGIGVNENSVVIITENMCSSAKGLGGVIVNDYQHTIFSHNASPYFAVNLPIPPVGAIENPNLLV